MAENQDKNKIPIGLLYLIILVIVIWLCTFWGVYKSLPTWTDRGQFGDLFGSINALFSGFAFAGIIYTIYLQKKELSLQREELKLQREEMKASRAVLSTQAKTQDDMYQVSIAQIRVNAQQASIEALKISAESRNPDSRDQEIKDINLIADEIKKIADTLELESNPEYQYWKEKRQQQHEEWEKEQRQKK